MIHIPSIPLKNGVELPCLGLGVYQCEEQTEQAVLWALEVGYRHIDTAALYGNERQVGAAVRASGLRRDEIFITTKLWDSEQKTHKQYDAFLQSLDRLGLDYIDLYLIHWPLPGLALESWRVLEKCYQEGLVRAIGVSNFHQHHLEAILPQAEIKPMVDQFECHPYHSQKLLLAFCKKEDIVCQAWSPLLRGGLMDDLLLTELAWKHGKSVAQIVLRWHIQNHVVPIPKSVHKERIYENADIFDFSLDEAEMAAIDGLNRNQARLDPDNR